MCCVSVWPVAHALRGASPFFSFRRPLSSVRFVSSGWSALRRFENPPIRSICLSFAFRPAAHTQLHADDRPTHATRASRSTCTAIAPATWKRTPRGGEEEEAAAANEGGDAREAAQRRRSGSGAAIARRWVVVRLCAMCDVRWRADSADSLVHSLCCATPVTLEARIRRIRSAPSAALQSPPTAALHHATPLHSTRRQDDFARNNESAAPRVNGGAA